jgi:hypothetical protein
MLKLKAKVSYNKSDKRLVYGAIPVPLSVVGAIAMSEKPELILSEFWDYGIRFFVLYDDKCNYSSISKDAVYRLAKVSGVRAPLFTYTIPDHEEDNVLSSFFFGYEGFFSYGKPIMRASEDYVFLGQRDALVTLVPKFLDAILIDLSNDALFEIKKYDTLQRRKILSCKDAQLRDFVALCASTYTKMRAYFDCINPDRWTIIDFSFLRRDKCVAASVWSRLAHDQLTGEQEDSSLDFSKDLVTEYLWKQPSALLNVVGKVLSLCQEYEARAFRYNVSSDDSY